MEDEDNFHYSVKNPNFVFLNINNLDRMNYDQIEKINNQYDDAIVCLIESRDDGEIEVTFTELSQGETDFLVNIQKKYISSFSGLLIVKTSEFHHLGFIYGIIDSLEEECEFNISSRTIISTEFIHLSSGEIIQIISFD